MRQITIGENVIKFWQDFTFKKPVPATVAFTAKRVRNDAFVLTGKGYGEQGSYGNGSIYVYRKDLPKNLDQRLMRITRQEAKDGD